MTDLLACGKQIVNRLSAAPNSSINRKTGPWLATDAIKAKLLPGNKRTWQADNPHRAFPLLKKIAASGI
ncbi:MAG: hypothetical protein HY789_14415 [Deltaproteobacteria bacterium]|nr:hypothetical protein [Deltaproteobacteria bacterium]